MATVRQSIWDALITRLQTINTPTYQTAIGSKVDEWRTDFDQIVREELPRLNVQDVEETGDPITFYTPLIKRVMKVTVYGFVAASTTAAAADGARALIGDIIKVIFTDQTFGNIARQVSVGDSKLDVAQGSRIYAGCAVSFDIEYHTNGYDPSTQG
jgi:hypothetical protein